MKKTLHILYYTIISILIPLPCLSVSPQKGNILFIDELVQRKFYYTRFFNMEIMYLW